MTVRILVTGATGFLGGAMARHWAAQGLVSPGDARVVALVRDPRSSRAARLSQFGIDLAPGDLRRPESLIAAARGCDLVFHAANEMRVRRREAIWAVGVEGTQALFEAARSSGASQFLFTSSFAVYGGGDGAREDDEVRPWGEVYGDGKIAAEAALQRIAADRHSPRLVVLRLPSVYGPGSPGWTIRPIQAARRKRLSIPGRGEFAFAYLYVENLLDVVSAAARNGASGTFNIHDGWTSFADFMGFYAKMAGTSLRRIPWAALTAAAWVSAAAAALSGNNPVLSPRVVRRLHHLPAPSADLPQAYAARRQLGWTSRVSLEQGMQTVRTWAIQEGLLPASAGQWGLDAG
jgi:dihydroflavonol-4-reductase